MNFKGLCIRISNGKIIKSMSKLQGLFCRSQYGLKSSMFTVKSTQTLNIKVKLFYPIFI